MIIGTKDVNICPIVIFSWRVTVLGGKKFLKQGYFEAIVKVFFLFLFVFLLVFFFKIYINIDRGESGRRGRGGRTGRGVGYLPRNCSNTFGRDCDFNSVE